MAMFRRMKGSKAHGGAAGASRCYVCGDMTEAVVAIVYPIDSAECRDSVHREQRITGETEGVNICPQCLRFALAVSATESADWQCREVPRPQARRALNRRASTWSHE